MAGLSDRDRKIIYILLIAMVIALPYFFYIKEARIQTEAVKAETIALEERYQSLLQMNEHREDYVNETKEMNDKRDAIVATFPGEIKQANYTMFLLRTEYSGEYMEDPFTGERIRKMPIWFNTVTYGGSVENSISSEESDTGLVGIENSSLLEYTTNYVGLKYLLKYLMDYKDPMIYSSISMKFNEKTGQISGEIILDQYAITGNDRPTLSNPDYIVNIDGVNIDLDLDKRKNRGNTNDDLNGVFGPTEVKGEVEETPEADEATGDNVGDDAAQENPEE